MVDILTSKSIPIEQVALRLGHEVDGRHKMRCISRTHRDATPSLSFDTRTNRFKCFACDLSGDVLDLVQITMGFDLRTAYDWLMSDMQLAAATPVPIHDNLRVARPGDARRLTKFWAACDNSGDWLAHKGLPAGRFGVRRVTQAAHNLIPEFPVGGLFIPYYQHGDITYGRWRNLGTSGSRFLGLPGADVILYNQDALSGLDGVKPLYLAEGESDTMSLTLMGHVAVGFPGATQFQLLARLEQWVGQLGPKIPSIVTAFDSDPAGDRLAAKVAELGLPVPITTYDLKGFNDVNDYYQSTLS